MNILKKPDEKKVEIHLIRGENLEGVKRYTYLAIYSHRVRDMKLSLLTKTTDLSEFGIIVATGEGEPDEETKNYIKKTFSSE